MLLADGSADLPWRGADDRRGFSRERVRSPRPTRPVDRVHERARNRPVVFGRHEQHGIDGGDSILQRPTRRRVVRVIVVRIQRQISDGNLAHAQLRRSEAHERLCQLPVDRCFRQAADEVAHGVCRHANVRSKGGPTCRHETTMILPPSPGNAARLDATALSDGTPGVIRRSRRYLLAGYDCRMSGQ